MKTRSVAEGCKVKTTKNPVFLGITYDSRLTFNKHVEGMCQKAASRNGLLKILVAPAGDGLREACEQYTWLPNEA
jgi:predicted GIY-YIG superfamily endonuclease